MINKTGRSYKQFQDVYDPLFDKMNKSSDTIFENMDFRPPVDPLYERFIKSKLFEAYISTESNLNKRYIIQEWLLDNVFQDAYYDVKYQLITENESLPYNIEYKLSKSYELLQESRPSLSTAISVGLGAGSITAGMMAGGPVLATLGFAVAGLVTVIGISDADRRGIVNVFEELGKFIGKLTTINFDIIGTGTKKEILASLRADKLADSLEECIKITGFNPNETSKFTRFIQRISNSHKEYDYVQCVGTNLINFYISVLEAVYKVLKASDVDDKVFQVMEGGLKRGALNEALFRNLARLSRNKNVYKLLDVVNKTNDALNDIIDTLVHSKDNEHSRIGHNLSKILDSELRNLAYKLHKDASNYQNKPALNRRNGAEYMKDENKFPGTENRKTDDRFSGNRSDNRSDNRNYNDRNYNDRNSNNRNYNDRNYNDRNSNNRNYNDRNSNSNRNPF